MPVKPETQSNTGRILYVLAVLIFGVLVPRWKGLEFLDVLVILPYACLSWMFAVPAATSAVASAGPSREAVNRAAFKAFLFSWGSSLLVLAMGLATVNVLNWHGSLLLPSTVTLLNALAIGLGGCVLLTGLSVLLTVQFRSAQQARNALRLVLLAGLLGIYFWLNRAPMEVRYSAVDLLSSGSAIRVAIPFLLASAIAGIAAWRYAGRRLGV